jgi:hypothetical protein
MASTFQDYRFESSSPVNISIKQKENKTSQTDKHNLLVN